MAKRMYRGWGRRGKIFTRAEFNNSYLKKNFGRSLTYERYKQEVRSANRRSNCIKE